MKIALAQINSRIGNIAGNTKAILRIIEKAEKEEVDLVVFPELALSGCLPDSLLLYDEFISQCRSSVDLLAAACKNISVIIGAPVSDSNSSKLYNGALLLSGGKAELISVKSKLYDNAISSESSYFSSGNLCSNFSIQGKRIVVAIGNDLFNEEFIEKIAPFAEQGIDLIINITATPYSENQPERRKRLCSAFSNLRQIPLIFLNHVGGHAGILYDGNSMLLNKQGNIVMQLEAFSEDYRLIAFDTIEKLPPLPDKKEEKSSIAELRKALIFGIREFFSKSGFTKAILGLSGGMDSAIVYTLAIEALGSENVLGLLLPSPYSTEHSISDSLKLAENLRGKTETIRINRIFDAVLRELSGTFEGLPVDTTEENIQARIRTILLMAISNKKGYVLLNTSNKSESAVGYGTLYGDLAGSLAVIGDLYKTRVYELAMHINENEEIIPENIITKAPSAELRPEQKDSDSLPPYEILDAILYQYIELGKGPNSIVNAGFDKSLVNRVLALVNSNAFKRYQSAPILRVSNRCFSKEWQVPLSRFDFSA